MSCVEVIRFFRDFSGEEQQKEIFLCVNSPMEFVDFAKDRGYYFTEDELKEELEVVWLKLKEIYIPPGAGSSEAVIRKIFCLLKEEGKI